MSTLRLARALAVAAGSLLGLPSLRQRQEFIIGAGQQYSMSAHVPHRTNPLGDGRVATLIRKGAVHKWPATSDSDPGSRS
ncbi:hypothetical protein WP1_111 [Pseudomonas phage WP1]